MIRKLRLKFIWMSMIAVLILLTAITVVTNYLNYRSTLKEADDILTMIPRFSSASGETGEERLLPYESRFFSVTMEAGESVEQSTVLLPAEDELTQSQAREYARQALEAHRSKGVIDDYRYILYDGKERTLVEFINIGQQLMAVRSFLQTSILITVICYLLFFVVLLFFSGRFIKPVAKSYEKQKQFITNAGHGLKTPLTIIDADVEVLQMDLEENEWLDDIRKQTSQLSSLTNDLIFLSKMEESEEYLQKIEFPFSEVVEETAESFRLLAFSSGRPFDMDIAPMLTYYGNEQSIRQMITILLDNALKYSPPKSLITLTIQKQGRTIQITVRNLTAEPLSKGTADMLFDRFYRMSSISNSEINGHGIGLSVARAIVEAHGGHIEAIPEEGPSLKFLVSLPL